jgi:transposase-like protein DUF772
LLRALLLQVLYSISSERALMDQIDLHLGFRWLVGLSLSGRETPTPLIWLMARNEEAFHIGDMPQSSQVDQRSQARLSGRILSPRDLHTIRPVSEHFPSGASVARNEWNFLERRFGRLGAVIPDVPRLSDRVPFCRTYKTASFDP